MSTENRILRFVLLDDDNDHFNIFDKIIKRQFEELNVESINEMSFKKVLKFVETYRDSKDFSGELIWSDLKNIIKENKKNIIFFIDVRWFHDNRAGIRFCKDYLWKTFPYLKVNTIILTVYPLGHEFTEVIHIDKNAENIDLQIWHNISITVAYKQCLVKHKTEGTLMKEIRRIKEFKYSIGNVSDQTKRELESLLNKLEKDFSTLSDTKTPFLKYLKQLETPSEENLKNTISQIKRIVEK